MFSAFQSFLQPFFSKGNLLIKDHIKTPSRFLLLYFIHHAIQSNQPIVFLSCQSTQESLMEVLRELRINLASLKKVGFHFLSVSQWISEHMDHSLPHLDNWHQENLFNSLDKPLIIMEYPSILLYLGYSVQQILIWIGSIQKCALQKEGTCIIQVHSDGDKELDLLNAFLCYTSHCILTVHPLSSGTSDTVDGEIHAMSGPLATLIPSQKIQYKMSFTGIEFYALGLARHVV